jgi:hypothetical protein
MNTDFSKRKNSPPRSRPRPLAQRSATETARPRKIKATTFSKRARLEPTMKFAAESWIGHWLMRIVFPAILAFALAGCVGSKPSNDDDVSDLPRRKQGDIVAVQDMVSPDCRYVCTVFGEIFYDTTGYRRHIYLRHAGEQRGFPGNVCVVEVGDDVEVSWASPTNLSVRLSYESPWFRQALPATTNIAGVTVVFSKLTR